MKLNIGCGLKKKEDYINIDISKKVGPDKVVDIEKGLPFDDNTFDVIYSSHCLEHIVPGKISLVLKEIVRVAKDGAKLNLVLPPDNIWSMTDICHYRSFSYSSFNQLLGLDNSYWFFDFKLKYLNKPSKLKMALVYLFSFFVKEIKFEFIIIKEIYK